MKGMRTDLLIMRVNEETFIKCKCKQISQMQEQSKHIELIILLYH